MTPPYVDFHRVTKFLKECRRGKGLIDLWFRKESIPSRPPVLSQYNLRVEPGEKVLLCGANGSGKTTVVHLAAGLMAPTEGRVTVGGTRADRFPRQQVGVMFSASMLYDSLSGYHNLEHSAYLSGVSQAVEAVDSAAQAWGLGRILSQPTRAYSRGYRTLLALARATLHCPSLLLLDEPIAFMDAEHRSRLKSFITNYRGTLLITDQDPDRLAPWVDRVAFL